MSVVWLWSDVDRFTELEEALGVLGYRVQRIDGELLECASGLYGRRGLLMVDGKRAGLGEALIATAAVVPVLVLGPCDDIPENADVMTMSDINSSARCAQHIVDVLTQQAGRRRYPRVKVNLSAELQGKPCFVSDISMYGVFIENAIEPVDTQNTRVRLTLGDGAIVNLVGSVVNRRLGGLAIRCMPETDMDLLLWLHLLIGEIAKNPLMGDVDPFGPLFR